MWENLTLLPPGVRGHWGGAFARSHGLVLPNYSQSCLFSSPPPLPTLSPAPLSWGRPSTYSSTPFCSAPKVMPTLQLLQRWFARKLVEHTSGLLTCTSPFYYPIVYYFFKSCSKMYMLQAS